MTTDILSTARRAFVRVGPPVVAAAGLAALLAIGTVSPAAGVASASVLALAALAVVKRPPAALLARAVALVLAAAAGAALVLCTLAWPVTVSLAAIVSGVVALAVRSPALALAAGVLLVGFEGSVKILLGLEPTPLPFSHRAVGAAAIDVALFAAVVGVVVADRGRTPRALWAAAGRVERGVLVLFAAWYAISFLQIAQSGELERGLHGFRLFQAYVLVGLAAAIVVSRPRAAARVAPVVLAIGLVVSAYAAARVALGPAAAEEAHARSVESVTTYDGTFRAVGSFSGAVGMGSFVMPLAVFGLVIGFLVPKLRLFAWTVASLATVAIVGSFGRAPLLGVLVGLLCLVVLLAAGRRVSVRRILAAAALALAVLGAFYGGLQLASGDSAHLQQRAEGVLNPLGDRSLELRLETWRRTLDDVADRPLGRGLGAAGAASATERGKREGLVTTDNSFLKVLLEQGIPVTAAFIAALVGIVAMTGTRLSRVSGPHRAVGLAALCAFVAFLALATMGEAVEQPGKVLAWAFAGLAVALALSGRERDDPVDDQRVAE